CGPIAFVGLVVPHIARAFVGATHARLLPAAAMGGATFLILCDFLSSRMMGWLFDSPMQIPVGVLTNLIGGVFFLYVLLTRRSGGAGM
ncbi:MAG: iron chelate uptake ABC transporter family permease subunit, partial [Phycisphaerae bacterium]|nr:iron chelate uptake ABC transporter family permease subunit [Phycisphaerae bacterium]